VRLDLVLQFVDRVRARATHRLVGIDDDPLQADSVAQRHQQRHQLHGRTVGIGDDAVVQRSIVRVDLGDDERDGGIHAPLARVIDDDGAAGGSFWREDLGSVGAGREQRNVNAVEGVRPRLAHGHPAAGEVDGAAVGT
jgi:hypothetical protein